MEREDLRLPIRPALMSHVISLPYSARTLSGYQVCFSIEA